MLAAGLLRADTAGQDATKHPAQAGYLLRQRLRRNCHSRRLQPLPEAVRRPALASGTRRMSVRVHPYFDAAKPKSRAGSRLSLPSELLRTEPAEFGYRSCTAPCAASGFGEASGAGAASLRISIRQPVNRAASRAFWPSLPMASDSWKSGTTTRAARPASSITCTYTTVAGDRALATNFAGSSS